MANEAAAGESSEEAPAPVAADVKAQNDKTDSIAAAVEPEVEKVVEEVTDKAEPAISDVEGPEIDEPSVTEADVAEIETPTDSTSSPATDAATPKSTTTPTLHIASSSTSATTVTATTTTPTQSTASSTVSTSVESGGGNSTASSATSNTDEVDSADSDVNTEAPDEINDANDASTETDEVALSDDEEAELVVVNHTDDSGGVEPVSEVETVEPGVTLDGQYLVTDDNYYQFSRQSCVPVGNGTFHCSQSTELSVDQQSVVYSARDADGDLEIYLKTKRGDVEQLTDNDLDDASPQLDAKSMQVVWQRFIDGRYQIVLYDLQNQKERQLTFSRTNNMEPKVSSEGIVWQAWDGHDWEIMYFDGTYTDQLTDNVSQDVAPAIEDGYVLWSVLGKQQQEAMVYSLESGESMMITDHEGGMIENPRFVLVYDTKFDNGDVVTQGFDPATGLSAPIAAKPAQDPVDIPETDPTGEIRALIQNKSAQKEKEVVHTTPQNDTPGNDLDLATSTATSTDTLNIKQIQVETDLEQATSTVPATGPDFELTEFDLVIAPTTTPSTTRSNMVEVVASTTSSSTQP